MPLFKNKVVMPVLTIVALLFVVGFVAYEVTKAEVTFSYNDETEQVITRQDTVAELLEELEVELGNFDYLSHALDTEIEDGMEIAYKEAVEVTLIDDDTSSTHMTTEDNVQGFLLEQNIELSNYDEITVDEEQEIEQGLEIKIDRAVQVTVKDGQDEEETIYTTLKTVADLLELQEIELNELDRVEPEKDEALSDDLLVQVTRVEEVTDVVEETISFSTVRRNDGSIEKGKEEVVNAGSEGLLEKRYTVTIENGEEVSRELVSEEVKEESAQRVVAVGTKVIQQAPSRSSQSASSSSSGSSSSSNSGERSGRTIVMEATAYNWDCPRCDGRGLTATGFDVRANPDGVVAVDPNVIPLGTRLYVEGYGYAVARDTGGAIKGNKIDLHMRSNAEARRFGRRNIKVTILD